MDLWRIGLLVASAAFLVFLVLRLRPRFGPERLSRAHPRETVAEKRVWARVVRLPRPAQQRLLERLADELGADDEDPADSEAAERGE
jgi:hypothetical protein